MIDEISLDAPSPLELKYALCVYENRSDEVAITKNEFKDGRLCAGKPLDVDAFIESFSQKMSPTKSAVAKGGGEAQWMDESWLAEVGLWRVWFTRPQLKKLFIAGKPRSCWLPGLIWAGHRQQHKLFMWSYRSKQRPNPDTIVYRPCFGPTDGMNHIHADSRVCLGTMNPGRGTPAEWMTAFYDTNFKTADGLPRKPYAIEKTHKKLGPLASLIESSLSSRASAD